MTTVREQPRHVTVNLLGFAIDIAYESFNNAHTIEWRLAGQQQNSQFRLLECLLRLHYPHFIKSECQRDFWESVHEMQYLQSISPFDTDDIPF